MRIAIAGTGHLSAGMFRALAQTDHEIVAVVQDGRQYKGLKGNFAAAFGRIFGGKNNIAALARNRSIPVVWIDKMDEAELAPLKALDIDLLLVGGFAIILKPSLLEVPKLGCVNMHSSLLPRHRGPNPFCAAILAGDAESGITFHVMEPGIDTGPILAQYAFPLEPRDSMFEVYRRACSLAEEKVTELIEEIAVNGLQGTPQNHDEANYARKPTVDDSWIDWRNSAEEIDRKVRAYGPTTMPRFRWRGRVVTVARTEFDSTPVDAAPGTVLRPWPVARVATGEGTLILRVAFCRRPVPWVWPAPWSKPLPLEQLEVEP